MNFFQSKKNVVAFFHFSLLYTRDFIEEIFRWLRALFISHTLRTFSSVYYNSKLNSAYFSQILHVFFNVGKFEDRNEQI